MQVGSLTISNTTSSTSNVTGALQVFGGTGIQGNLYVANNVFVGKNANVANITVRGYHVGPLNFSGSDTIYINGSPVANRSAGIQRWYCWTSYNFCRHYCKYRPWYWCS